MQKDRVSKIYLCGRDRTFLAALKLAARPTSPPGCIRLLCGDSLNETAPFQLAPVRASVSPLGQLPVHLSPRSPIVRFSNQVRLPPHSPLSPLSWPFSPLSSSGPITPGVKSPFRGEIGTPASLEWDNYSEEPSFNCSLLNKCGSDIICDSEIIVKNDNSYRADT